MLREERAELAALLHSLSEQEWESPSLCAGWRVRDVVGHLLYDATTLSDYMMVGVRCGFSPDGVNNALVDRAKPLSVAELLDRFEHNGEHITRLVPKIGLADMFVHQQDIRRPLGHPRTVPPERLRAVLAHPDPFARPGRYTSGLRFIATDVEWSRGVGPEVSGPGEALALAMVGRTVALDELTGDGVPILRLRHG
ncbi:maleylpyruvate isomerase family mycothiol-dependent enzyme [Nocardia macrotermitis]|uniref:Mycothiol-dependent maleylpyruvate isomerase metal-binding domain-containing protein n=1 Tax=Nocardia macrotermitis TaxID=2585198 RepID=A0A7K0D656_9NOCA|nr:maleylpyruvate isomerase family mycothiol-dependent enzyme [Nocardia macrotermitis]MQY21210.1 hypothetical protein [Nocardia macrotermitis]